MITLLKAEGWYSQFNEVSIRDYKNDPRTELGACRERVLARRQVEGKFRGEEWDEHNREWTAVMGVFLSRLANSQTPSCIQEWEWAPASAIRVEAFQQMLHDTEENIRSYDRWNWAPRGPIDLAWFEEGAVLPSVIIEHENQSAGIEEELLKLVQRLIFSDPDSFAVLITYPWEGHEGQGSQDIQTRIATLLSGFPSAVERFLLVLGGDDWEALRWQGFLWEAEGFRQL